MQLQKPTDSITKVIMNLSAFGVESDDYPTINVFLDFAKDSSNCVRPYYDPKFDTSSYKLSHDEMKKILRLLETSDLTQLKAEYTTPKTDQPTSTTTIYAGHKIFTVKDYGLVADSPLQELYDIVYKFEF
jgi:hypothetical protein